METKDRCPICNSRKIHVKDADSTISCYNCGYDARKETIEQAKARVPKYRIVKVRKTASEPKLVSVKPKIKVSSPSEKKVSCAVCGKTPPNSVRKDGTYFCTVCGYDSADNTYIMGYDKLPCPYCGSKSKYFHHDGVAVCYSCKHLSPRYNRVPYETVRTKLDDDVLPFTSPEVMVNGKVLSLFVDKDTMKLSVDGAETSYPVNVNNNVVFTIGKMGKIDVDYRNPIELLGLYVRLLKHAILGRGAFEKEWREVVRGTNFDFDPLTVLQLIERGLLTKKQVETKLIPLMNEKFTSVREQGSAQSLFWAAEKAFEMGIYNSIEKEIRDVQDLVKVYRQKAKEEVEARKKALAAGRVPVKASEPESPVADANPMNLPDGLEKVSKTQVLQFDGYRLHYTLSHVEKV